MLHPGAANAPALFVKRSASGASREWLELSPSNMFFFATLRLKIRHRSDNQWITEVRKGSGDQSRSGSSGVKCAIDTRRWQISGLAELQLFNSEDGRTAGQARPLLLVVAGRGTPATAAVWPDAPANLGAAGAERVAPRLQLQILGLKVGSGSVRENDCTAASGICQTAETSR